MSIASRETPEHAVTASDGKDPELYRGWATIRGDWDRFYREFPGIYDRFSLSTDLLVRDMRDMFGFDGATVLVLAAGTGRDSFEIARNAARVIGVEPWIEMRSFALAKQKRLGVRNVAFVYGVAEDLSRFADAQFDRVVSIHGAPFPWDNSAFVAGALRVVRPGGHVAFGGALGSPQADDAVSLLATQDFAVRDVAARIDYGSVEEALATWGFIYGDRAIDDLLERRSGTADLRLWTAHRRV
jgi:ubiquinone/menaquinone biosynthesis C-methylase UbiE